MLRVDKEKLSLIIPIFGSHVKRIGWYRVLAAAGLMYAIWPISIIIHVNGVIVLYRLTMQPLLGLPKLDISKYIILDRHKIAKLHWIDRAHCLYCGYGNGLMLLWNEELDNISNVCLKSVPFWKRSLVAALFLSSSMTQLLASNYGNFMGKKLIKVLGLHRTRLSVLKQIKKKEYGEHWPAFHRRWLTSHKEFALHMASLLEQLESAWCPLKHEQRTGAVLPEHHGRFFERNEIETLTSVLSTAGSVSDRPPRY